jgi:hypothetical protein
LSDILRRVSIVIHQHIQKCEIRQALVTEATKESGKFHMSQLEKFSEANFMVPDYVYHFVRAPISRMGFLYGIHKVTNVAASPSLQDIHTFLSDLFTKALLSAECSIGTHNPFHSSPFSQRSVTSLFCLYLAAFLHSPQCA